MWLWRREKWFDNHAKQDPDNLSKSKKKCLLPIKLPVALVVGEPDHAHLRHHQRVRDHVEHQEAKEGLQQGLFESYFLPRKVSILSTRTLERNLGRSHLTSLRWKTSAQKQTMSEAPVSTTG